jgi:hypothetical protein
MPDREQRVTPIRAAIRPGVRLRDDTVTVLMSENLALPTLTALALLAAWCWALILWDVRHYREHRVVVRQDRP